ncbi:MAG: ATP synthase F1 subunit epsilon [Bacteroidia bacterium]
MAFLVEIVTPDKKIYSGEATSIRVPGTNGSFEILNHHAPIISTLGKGQVRILTTAGNSIQYEVQDGVIEMLNNKVSVLIEKIISSSEVEE